MPILAVSVGLAALIAYGFWPSPVKVDYAKVKRGSLQVTVDDDGETRIREKYIVSAPLAGQLLRLQLHPGDLVEQTETEIAQILPLEPNLLDARSQAEIEARVRATDAAMQQADAAKDSTVELAELAQHQLDRAMQLIKTNSISQQEMDDVEHHVAVTKANLRAAEFGLKVRAFQREQAVAASKRVNDKFQDRSTTALRIVSPTGGKILRVFREDSGVVAIGAPLVEVGDVQDLEMVLDILSSEAVRIEPGDHVFIERWGGDHSLKGIVRRIEPFAFLKVSALGVEEKRVNVIADFEDAWEVRQGLGDGFRIEARIVIHETDVNSLRVASGALFRHEDRWHVYRIRHGKVELVQVDVGASNGLEAEICSGLDESDVVVLYPTQQIRAGVRVLENR